MENTCVCCGTIIPEGRLVCSACEKWNDNQSKYGKKTCPECGAPLEVYYDGRHTGVPEAILIRHCKKCLRDWESWLRDDGTETELQRKFWG